MAKCPSCLYENTDTAKICIKCGTAIAPTVEHIESTAVNATPTTQAAPSAPAASAMPFGTVSTPPVRTPPPPPPPPPRPRVDPPKPVAAAAPATASSAATPTAKGGNSKLIVGGGVAVALLIGGFLFSSKSSTPSVAPTTTPSPARAESQAKTAKDQLNEILGLVRDNRWKDVKSAAANLKALAQAPQGNRRLSEEETQIGVKNFEARNYAEAITHFEKAVGADASNVEPRFYLGRALNRTGKFDTAKNVLIDALIIQPDRGASWFTTAEVFAELDKKDEATFALKLAVFFSKNREQAIASLKDKSKIESDKFWKIIEDVRPVLSGVPASN